MVDAWNVSTYFYGKQNKNFDAEKMADDLQKQIYTITLRDNDEIYCFNKENGIYEPNGDKRLKELVKQLLGRELNITRWNNTKLHVQIDTYKKRDELNTEPHLLHLKNGIYNIKNNEFFGFDPTTMCTTLIPITYNPLADCPVIKKFIGEIVPGEDIPTLQELIGYCLLKEYRIQQAFMLYGGGSNGKTTFLNLLKTFLGTENITSIELQQIVTNRFATAELYGKMANICSDLPKKALLDTGRFKSLTGNDSVTAEEKMKKPFDFTNYAKMIFSCNEFPRSPDLTDAYCRRWMIVVFPNKFEGTTDDKDLLNKLITEEEKSGLFNWALEGLQRLLKNDQFTNTKSSEEMREWMIRLSDSLAAFCQDMVEYDPEGIISKEEFYGKYVEYCEEKKNAADSKTLVGRRLSGILSGVKDHHTGSLRCWKGIKFVEPKLSVENSSLL